MADSQPGSSGTATPPFVALLAKSLGVCIVGGAFFGALMALGVDAVSRRFAIGAGAGDLDRIPFSKIVADGAFLLLIGTMWGLLFAVPVGIPAGTIAAGLIWWLRGVPWRPRSRTTWSLVGGLAGLGLSALLAALLSRLTVLEAESLQAMFVVFMGTGAACGAVLAWLVAPDFIADRA